MVRTFLFYTFFHFQALVMESASLKHKLHRHDEHQLGAYLKSLHQVLKCCLSALTAYTHHLPFTSASPQLMFPPPLKALAAMVKVFSVTNMFHAFNVLSLVQSNQYQTN